MQPQIHLGINIDHVATLRNARGENDPSLVELALLAQNSGADSITIHLREDRRHVRDADIFELKKHLKIPINFEMALSEEILSIAQELKPMTVCLVPERREEVTTEGGLDAVRYEERIQQFTAALKKIGSETFLFIEPEEKMLAAAKNVGAKGIEFHTGAFAQAFLHLKNRAHEVERIRTASQKAAVLGLEVHAGHGINYFNVYSLLPISEITEFNIGHAIIARSLSVGLPTAIQEMKRAMAR